MPAFAASDDPAANRLSPEELDLLVAWLRGEWYEPASEIEPAGQLAQMTAASSPFNLAESLQFHTRGCRCQIARLRAAVRSLRVLALLASLTCSSTICRRDLPCGAAIAIKMCRR